MGLCPDQICYRSNHSCTFELFKTDVVSTFIDLQSVIYEYNFNDLLCSSKILPPGTVCERINGQMVTLGLLSDTAIHGQESKMVLRCSLPIRATLASRQFKDHFFILLV